MLEQSRKCFGRRICGQCLCMFVFFSFHFSFFLSSSHFCLDRPFGFSTHRGIVFFMPLFLPELPLKVVNPSRCSFLPKPPFRVFNLASIFIFSCFLFCFFILATDHRPSLGGRLASNLNWNRLSMLICSCMFHLNVHSFPGSFSKYSKKISIFRMFIPDVHHYQHRRNLLYKALKIEQKMSAKQKHRLKSMYKGGSRPKARPHRFTNLEKW